ncbi:TetR/AcrR family transcriptional regulator [Pseudomonas cichorii]|uniref:TetR/AcrR family transcriptional regulator n=1 Tax=Pseudomonas cichorii TaxID=36746 RepID=UPI0018E622EB|nr:TetR/AcrR family transcriptional regulator [Pseudomonas cichorii]MBI6853707.1 TetR/AcrR family transcriptional regulator [Pseudomonas cichorii]
MKVSKAQVQANRAHIVETASRLFRERGYDGIGIADLMAAAGFTHGGFYKHFGSKTDLMAEAAQHGLTQSAAQTSGGDLSDFVAHYVSRNHRDKLGEGCTMAALCADASRQPPVVKETFAAGIESLLAATELDGSSTDAAEVRAKKLNAIAHAVGTIVLSRACPDDSLLAQEILDVCRDKILADLSPAITD